MIPVSRLCCASALGELVLEARDGALVSVRFRDQANLGALPDPPREESEQRSADNALVLKAGAAWLERYFCGEDPGAAPPLRLYGTPFQQAVWSLLTDIPYGEVRSYGQLAEALGSSARAVGGAVGRNPISILVPCHRVVGAKGKLTGYAGGLSRKQALLSLEQQASIR